jgi:Zn-dependent peptidase ImmA (M78 family)
MNNAQKAAQGLLSSIGWTSPQDFTIEEIAYSLDVMIKYCSLDGSEGRILMNKNSGIISVNSKISYDPKKRFVISHEIGHFQMHKGLSKLYSDTDETLRDWYSKGIQEKQANDFASELLMPTKIYKSKIDNKRLTVDLIASTAEFFGTSLLATFLRYVNLGSYPCMVVYMDDRKVKWTNASNDFPFQWLEYESDVPPYTVAGDYFYQNNFEDSPEIIEAIEWFPEDREIEKKGNWKLWEQCYRIGDSGLVSCIWTY